MTKFSEQILELMVIEVNLIETRRGIGSLDTADLVLCLAKQLCDFCPFVFFEPQFLELVKL